MPIAKSAAWRATLHAMLLTLLGCATSSPPPLPVPAERLTLPAPPRTQEPAPSGAYWAGYCRSIARVRSVLSVTLPDSAACESGPTNSPQPPASAPAR